MINTTDLSDKIPDRFIQIKEVASKGREKFIELIKDKRVILLVE